MRALALAVAGAAALTCVNGPAVATLEGATVVSQLLGARAPHSIPVAELLAAARQSPLTPVVVPPGQSLRLYSGALDQFGGVVRAVVVATPVTLGGETTPPLNPPPVLPAGYVAQQDVSRSTVIDGSSTAAGLVLFPVRAQLEIRVRAKNRDDVFLVDLGRSLEVNLAGTDGEIYVQNFAFADFPQNLVANVPLLVELALAPAVETLPPLHWTYFPTPIPPANILAFCPVPAGAKRVFIPPVYLSVFPPPAPNQVPSYAAIFSVGQWQSPTTAVDSFDLYTFDFADLQRLNYVVPVPDNANLLTIFTEAVTHPLPRVVQWEVVP